MELYTLNRKFLKETVADDFLSVIWTERYYGDSVVEMVVPENSPLVQSLTTGKFLALKGSQEVMILETSNIEDGKLKVTGISLLTWLNNRFVRTSAKHEDRYWYIDGNSPGWILWAIIYYMCHKDSPYMTGAIDVGIPNPQRFAIPGLYLIDCDQTLPGVKVGVPFGPVFDAMKEIATTYAIGMQLLLTAADSSSYSLGFRSYRGLDRTSGQTTNPVIRFSPQMDSFTDIKELQSIAALKTSVFSFAPGLNPEEGQPDIRSTPGISELTGPQYTGFDLRALLVFAEDITTNPDAQLDEATLLNILNSRASDALSNNSFVKAVDGEIVHEAQFRYGRDYHLGDIIEVQGNSDIVSTARVTEYIHSQDAAGEKAYPTVTMIN